MTEPTELLPCPFCGHAGPLDFQDGSTHRWGVASCASCGASAGETRREYPDTGDWHAKAIAQWNTRTPQPTQAQAGAVPLTDREIELIDGMIAVQLDHASRCDAIANRAMADKQESHA